MNKIVVVMLFLFLLEMVLGYTGTTLLIAQVPIRTILLYGTFFSLYVFVLLYMIVNKIPIFSCKRKTIFSYFTFLDYSVLVFLLVMLFSCLITPVIKNGSLSFSIEEVLGILIRLTFYFPLRFMIQWKCISLKNFSKFLYYVLFVLSLSSIILFVLQSHNSNFLNEYFQVLHELSAHTSISPDIILGHNFVRIYFATSIFILLGVYLFFNKFPKINCFDIIVFVLHIMALIATFLRSMWIGCIIGFLFVFVAIVCILIKQKDLQKLLKVAVIGGVVGITIIISDAYVFDGLVIERWDTLFIKSEQSEEHIEHNQDDKSSGQDIAIIEEKIGNVEIVEEEIVEEKTANVEMAEEKIGDVSTTENESRDDQGVLESNNVRIEQMQKLFEKWKQSPLIGHGFGSYVEDCIRSEVSPYSYEMQFHALLMKTGILGIASLIFLIGAMIYVAIKSWKQVPYKVIAWFYLLISLGISTQTNPILLSTTGITIVTVLLIVAYDFECTCEGNEVR